MRYEPDREFLLHGAVPVPLIFYSVVCSLLPHLPLSLVAALRVDALALATVEANFNCFDGPLIHDVVPAIRDTPTIRTLCPISTVLSPPSDSGITVNGRPLLYLSPTLNYSSGKTEAFG